VTFSVISKELSQCDIHVTLTRLNSVLGGMKSFYEHGTVGVIAPLQVSSSSLEALSVFVCLESLEAQNAASTAFPIP
jgi:hypothetical protein